MTFAAPAVIAALAVVTFIVWLVRLEGRVNVQSENIKTVEREAKADTLRFEKELVAANMKVEAESRAHRGTSDALIRLEEAVKHLTRLFEQHFAVTTAASTTRRRTKTAGDE
jgi:hypothetical protein